MATVNSDGLLIKFPADEGIVAQGGSYKTCGDLQEVEIKLNLATDVASATAAIAGAGTTRLGTIIPAGARIEEVETVVETAATVSAGTVGAATIVLGCNRLDRTTVVSATGLTAATATGTALGLATVGTKTVIRVGSTGVGALVGTTLANAILITVANSTGVTNIFSGGKLVVRVRYYFPQTNG